MIQKFCECGCGKEVKIWSNGRTSPFLRGHHTRKKDGYKPPVFKMQYCQCGCGEGIKPLPSGHINKFIKGHHLKGHNYTIETRLQRMENRWGHKPTLSPYLDNVFIKFNEKQKRWYACVKTKNNKSTSTLHSNAVYKKHFGDIPKGYVVHHKNGKHERLDDDRPENLMLLLDEWNLRFFPVLAKGFGVKEKIVTDSYLEVFDINLTKEDLFKKLCEIIIIHKNKSEEEVKCEFQEEIINGR